MINILIINFGEQFGGIEVHVKSIIENIDYKKFNVNILARKNSKFFYTVESMIKEGYDINLYSIEIAKNKIIKNMKFIKEIVIKDNIEIVHAHGILASYMYSLVKVRDVKFITSTHGYCYYDRMDRGKAVISLFNYMEKTALKKSDKCIAVSNDIKRYIYEKGISEEKITVINHGIDVNIDTDEFEREIPIKEIDYGENYLKTIKIKTLGRLEKVKGYNYLIEALRICIDKGYNLECEIAGAGDEFNNLNELIKELNLESHCKLVGFVNDVKGFLNDADIYVQCSKIESFGISILEAMENDVPVIASRVGGITDIIKQGYNGLLFEEGNIDELSKCIMDLIDNKEKRIILKENARLKLKESFNITNKIKEIEQVYAHVSK